MIVYMIYYCILVMNNAQADHLHRLICSYDVCIQKNKVSHVADWISLANHENRFSQNAAQS